MGIRAARENCEKGEFVVPLLLWNAPLEVVTISECRYWWLRVRDLNLLLDKLLSP